jgi:hypothetical protein
MRRIRTSWILGGGRNALRRRIDRVEAAVLVGLAVLFVIAAPLLAVFAAHLTQVATLREARADSSFREVSATLLTNANAGRPEPDGWANVALVSSRWIAPDGRVRTGPLEVGLGMRAGSHVQIWVTRSGQLTAPPPSGGDMAARMALAAVTAVFGLAGLLSLVAVAVRLAADRRRMADWARAWAATSPRWSQFR